MHDGSRAEPVLFAYGITTVGSPVLLAVEPGGDESFDAWAGFLEDLSAGGSGRRSAHMTPGACAPADITPNLGRHRRGREHDIGVRPASVVRGLQDPREDPHRHVRRGGSQASVVRGLQDPREPWTPRPRRSAGSRFSGPGIARPPRAWTAAKADISAAWLQWSGDCKTPASLDGRQGRHLRRVASVVRGLQDPRELIGLTATPERSDGLQWSGDCKTPARPRSGGGERQWLTPLQWSGDCKTPASGQTEAEFSPLYVLQWSGDCKTPARRHAIGTPGFYNRLQWSGDCKTPARAALSPLCLTSRVRSDMRAVQLWIGRDYRHSVVKKRSSERTAAVSGPWASSSGRTAR